MPFGRQSNIVLVFDAAGKVLVLRRGPTDPWQPGRWNFPGGRREPSDQSARHAAARELAEEAGICVDPASLNWAFSYREPALVNVFWVRLSERPKVQYLDGEHDAHAWSKLWEIPQPTIHHVRYVVEQITGKTWNLAPVGSTPSEQAPLYGSPRTGDTPSGGRSMSSKWNKSDYLAYWPKYQPFPYAIRRGKRPVPNVNSVDWPQAQFAPPYLPPGSPSFQAYSYTKNDVPLSSQQPRYTTVNYGPYRRSGVGPGGDLARLPLGYGGLLNNPSEGSMNAPTQFTVAERDYVAMSIPEFGVGINAILPEAQEAARVIPPLKKLRALANRIRALHSREQTPAVRRQIKKSMVLYRALLTELGLHTGERLARKRMRQYAIQQALAAEASGVLPAPSLARRMRRTPWGLKAAAPVRRAGWIATTTPIKEGVPATTAAAIPPSTEVAPVVSAGLGLSEKGIGFGDGFAYELAPLQASAPYDGYGAADCYGADCYGNSDGQSGVIYQKTATSGPGGRGKKDRKKKGGPLVGLRDRTSLKMDYGHDCGCGGTARRNPAEGMGALLTLVALGGAAWWLSKS